MTKELLPPASSSATEAALPATLNTIGIDIGGTKIASAIVTSQFNNKENSLQHFVKTKTPQSAQEFLSNLIDIINDVKSKFDGDVHAIGISTAGMVNSITGTVLGATGNVPFLNEIPNLKEILEAELNLPVVVENDANAAAYGEYKVGAGQAYDSTLMVTLGTGVGGGFVINNEIFEGSRFCAQEIGHICIDRTKSRSCTCGRDGCWEAFASGTGLRITIRETIKELKPEDTKLLQLDLPIYEVGTHALMDCWKAGDKVSQQIIDRWHQDIAVGLGSVINVLDPESVVVGGGLCKFVNLEQLKKLTYEQAMMPGTPVEIATLGNEAGLVGAAFLAMEHLKKNQKTAYSSEVTSLSSLDYE